MYSTEVTLFNNKFGTKIPNLETLGSPIRRGQKKMLPFLGNTLAKVIQRDLCLWVCLILILLLSLFTEDEWINMQSCRKGRLQCRDFSSGSEKGISLFIGISISLLKSNFLFLILVGINFLFVSCLESLSILLHSGLWWCWIPARYVVCNL